ncbi:hypothetical protein J2Z69_001605 [Paenibacillus shirakamiensis]|uniref:Uncharacterized protein n=1 Tax=Paenibacillus shirakamiensis TaxID=1265935 RepID=A0ABS4JFT1_9BACL|nr:hypothetical protein [Paenibacillus shirakamiensis]MBP2000574.1 hypothetical protein [Paenibacillus shirakamiensis]
MKFVGLYLSLIFVITACSSLMKQSPSEYIKVTAISQEAGPKINLQAIQASDYMDVFENRMKKIQDVPYTIVGDKIQITLADPSIQSCELMEYILSEDGSLKYDLRTVHPVNLQLDKGTGTFILERNLFAHASSNIKDYEKGAVYRGFRLVVQGKNEVNEYAFVLRTDAV